MDKDSSSRSDPATSPLDYADEPVTVGVDIDCSVVDEYLREVVDRGDVTVVDNVKTFNDRERFEASRKRARRLRGNVLIVVVNEDGELLLVENSWMNGYGIPGGGVEPGEDWEVAARREVREETGVVVELDRPLAVYGGVNEHADDRFRGPYALKYLAHPVDDGELADDPGATDDEIEAVEWFESMPDRANNPDALGETFRRFAGDS